MSEKQVCLQNPRNHSAGFCLEQQFTGLNCPIGSMASYHNSSNVAYTNLEQSAFALECSALNSRTLHGHFSETGLADLPNLYADSLYIHYLRNAEYAPHIAPIFSDPFISGNSGTRNTYMDVVEFEVACSQLVSSQKQYGMAYLTKQGNLNNGYHGIPSPGLSMSYSGGSFSAPVFPASPLELASPVRNDEFKSNKTKSFELSEIAGHVVVFSTDQYGSRFIQRTLETTTAEEKKYGFCRNSSSCSSIDDRCVWKICNSNVFQHGTTTQIREIADLQDMS